MQPLEFLFSFAQEARIGYCVPVGVRVELLQAHINPDLCPCCDMLHVALSLDSELHNISICTFDEANPLDLFDGEGRNLLLFVANQTKTPDATAIRERDVLPIGIKLPACSFVLHRAVIVLKAWIAFLSWLVGLAVVEEALNRRPRPIRCGLSCLGIEKRDKGVRFGEHSAKALQVIGRDLLTIHPHSQAFVADKLGDSDGLINGCIVLRIASNFILVGQHVLPISRLLSLFDIFSKYPNDHAMK